MDTHTQTEAEETFFTSCQSSLAPPLNQLSIGIEMPGHKPGTGGEGVWKRQTDHFHVGDENITRYFTGP